MQHEKLFETQIATFHFVERSNFDWQTIQQVDFLHICVSDIDKSSSYSSQVLERVQFVCALGFAKRCPVKQASAQIYRRRVQSVNRVLEFESDKVGCAVKLACSSNQQRNRVCINAPISGLHCIDQLRPMNSHRD